MKTTRRIIKAAILLLATIIIMLGVIFSNAFTSSHQKRDVTNSAVVTVTRIVDGDTFVASQNGEEIRVRLIGVDTPESKATGKNAYKNCEEGLLVSEYTRTLIENKNVTLEYDVSITDKYGRRLCYVYLEDGRMLNEVLLQRGYARLMTIPPDVKYAERFTRLQDEAKSGNKGFWNSENPPWYD